MCVCVCVCVCVLGNGGMWGWKRGRGSFRDSDRMPGWQYQLLCTHRSNQTLLGLEVLITCKGAHGTHKGSRHAEDVA